LRLEEKMETNREEMTARLGTKIEAIQERLGSQDGCQSRKDGCLDGKNEGRAVRGDDLPRSDGGLSRKGEGRDRC
jgi:hypothetical protein